MPGWDVPDYREGIFPKWEFIFVMIRNGSVQNTSYPKPSAAEPFKKVLPLWTIFHYTKSNKVFERKNCRGFLKIKKVCPMHSYKLGSDRTAVNFTSVPIGTPLYRTYVSRSEFFRCNFYPQGEVRLKRRTEENWNIIIEAKKTVIPRNGPHSLFCFQIRGRRESWNLSFK